MDSTKVVFSLSEDSILIFVSVARNVPTQLLIPSKMLLYIRCACIVETFQKSCFDNSYV